VIDLPISDKNTKMLIVIPKELKKDLENEAKEDNRSLSNYVITILESRPKK
jgi:predicted HicB family RNase H-like nuclease